MVEHFDAFKSHKKELTQLYKTSLSSYYLTRSCYKLSNDARLQSNPI